MERFAGPDMPILAAVFRFVANGPAARPLLRFSHSVQQATLPTRWFQHPFYNASAAIVNRCNYFAHTPKSVLTT